MTKKRARAYVYVTVKRTSSENHLGDYSIRKCGELTKKNRDIMNLIHFTLLNG